jgi:hypothetical protein
MKNIFNGLLKKHYPELNWNFNKQSDENSDVYDHISRGIKLDLQRYLMIFFDRPITQQLLLLKIQE